MRPRDVRIPLYDMLQAADAIASFIEGRSGVIEPELATRLSESRGVIDFRNVIAHDTIG